MAEYPTKRAIVKDTIAAVNVEESQSKSSKILRPKILISQTPEYEAVTAVKPKHVINITNDTAEKRFNFSLSINRLVRASKIEIVEVIVANASNK